MARKKVEKEIKTIHYEGGLTEDKLIQALRVVYPLSEGFEVRTGVTFGKYKASSVVFKNGKAMKAFEFDGPRHFNSFVTQERDSLKNKAISDKVPSLIRIPYFIQLTEDVMNYYFPGMGVHSTVQQEHGFVDSIDLCPCDFNTRGIKLFKYILHAIPESVFDKIKRTMYKHNFTAEWWEVKFD